MSPQLYQPASPFEFGEKCGGLWSDCSAHAIAEKVAIWGTDADGITATAVLWDGLVKYSSILLHP